MDNKYVVICMSDGEAVMATSKIFDKVSEALDYSMTVDQAWCPVVLNLNDFKEV